MSTRDRTTLRRQEYWSLLSGAAGQLYGNKYTWQFIDGWKDHVDTTGVKQLRLVTKLFATRQWFRLVPDQRHELITAGYGTVKTDGKCQRQRLRHRGEDSRRQARDCVPANAPCRDGRPESVSAERLRRSGTTRPPETSSASRDRPSRTLGGEGSLLPRRTPLGTTIGYLF